MTQTLPTFEEDAVEEAVVRIVNCGDGLSDALKVKPLALHIDDEVAYIIRGKVASVNHKKKKPRKGQEGQTLVRVHTIDTIGITEVDMDMAKRILTAAADNLARAKNEIEGQLQLQADEDLEGAEALASMREGALDPSFIGPE